MCCTEIKNWTDSAEITNMIETCPRYSRNLIREGEVRVKYWLASFSYATLNVVQRGWSVCGSVGLSTYAPMTGK